MGHILYTLFIFPVAELIEFCYTILYRVLNDYGLATIGLSFVITLATLPIYMVAESWQDVERRAQLRMAPKLKKIRQAFKGDERFMITSAYYREQHYKPIYALRSSFSILIQIPFFLAAYRFLSDLPALRGYSFLFLKDLGEPDGLLKIGSYSLNLLPIAMTTANCISGWLYTKGHPLREKVQVYGMAAIFLVILYSSPSGLLLYWTMNNVLSLVKNIFYKLKHPVKTLLVLFYLALVCGCVLVTKRGVGRKQTLFIIYGLSAFLALLPLWYRLAMAYEGKCLAWLEQNAKLRGRLFLLSLLSLLFLLGGLVPLNLIASSPTEFAFLEPYQNPMAFSGLALLQACGFFIWGFALYKLFNAKIQTFFALVMLCLFAFALVNIFLFPGSYGSLSAGLQFSDANMGGQQGRKLLDLLVLLLVFAVVLVVLALHWYKAVSSVLTLLLIGMIAMAGLRTVTIVRSYREYAPQHAKLAGDINNLEPVFTFSKTGRNVLVLMLDRAMNAYIPYMLEEKPELKDTFSGFTYYPNTTSFGGNTIYGSAALFGGYEYTPKALNDRPNETLVDKNNQALKVLPKLFADHGYEAVVANPPWSNYKWYFDGSPFEGMEHVEALGITSRYASWWRSSRYQGKTVQYSALLEANLLRYALLEASPLVTHAILYDNGTWLNEMKPELNTTGGLEDLFVRQYATMEALPFITQVTEDPQDRYNSFDSELPHEEVILQIPDYVPVEKPDNSQFQGTFVADKQYHVNMASILLLGKWIDFLKQNGVYDNTRIIVASDHGARTGSWKDPEEVTLPDGKHKMNQYRALLMVKDFGGSGALKTDERFMTVADVPALATENLITEAKNPYTGNVLSMDGKKDGAQVTTATAWMPEDNGKYTLTIKDEQWFTVKDDIRLSENWREGL